jgi:predicted tellurium resistance membrane protein TerC
MAELLTVENGIALLTLTAMELVLGIDNLVFITILVGRVPEAHRARIRTIGLLLAVVMRVGLLLTITWIMGLTKVLWSAAIPLVYKSDGTPKTIELTGQSIILLLGGLFLLAKATYEIHHKLEDGDGHVDAVGADAATRQAARLSAPLIIVQILLLDLVFSLDSVITAVGMVKSIPIMVVAVLIAVGGMIAFAGALGRFVERHPAIKMLALAFLVLIGVMLVAEGLGEHVPKGYIYFAMAFSLGVEILNIRAGARRAAAAAKA